MPSGGEISKGDKNFRRTVLGLDSTDDDSLIIIRLDPTTKRLLVESLLVGYDTDGTTLQVPNVIESTDTPGVYGLVVVNADGSSVSAGGATAATDNLLLETGDALLLETGDLLLLE